METEIEIGFIEGGRQCSLYRRLRESCCYLSCRMDEVKPGGNCLSRDPAQEEETNPVERLRITNISRER